MFKIIFQGANDLAVFPIISLILFMSIFVSVLVWLFIVKKPYLNKMSHLPLEEKYSEESRNR